MAERELVGAAAPPPSLTRSEALTFMLGVGAVGVGIDQFTKWLAVTKLVPEDPVSLLGSWLQLQLTRNAGAAFSLGESFTYAYTALGIVVIGAIVFLTLRKIRALPWALLAGLGFAGVAGNLVDRLTQWPGIFQGWVIDFIYVKHFATFNVADICLTVTAGLLIVFVVKGIPYGSKEAEGAEGSPRMPEGPRASAARVPETADASPDPIRDEAEWPDVASVPSTEDLAELFRAALDRPVDQGLGTEDTQVILEGTLLGPDDEAPGTPEESGAAAAPDASPSPDWIRGGDAPLPPMPAAWPSLAETEILRSAQDDKEVKTQVLNQVQDDGAGVQDDKKDSQPERDSGPEDDLGLAAWNAQWEALRGGDDKKDSHPGPGVTSQILNQVQDDKRGVQDQILRSAQDDEETEGPAPVVSEKGEYAPGLAGVSDDWLAGA